MIFDELKTGLLCPDSEKHFLAPREASAGEWKVRGILSDRQKGSDLSSNRLLGVRCHGVVVYQASNLQIRKGRLK